MKRAQSVLGILVVLIAVVILVFRQKGARENHPPDPRPRERKEPVRPPSDEPVRIEGLNRNKAPLVFTKHARCRMACRHIDEEEVKAILATGRINDRKSDPAARPDPKYALEGTTRDGQEVRIIFAPSDRGMVVITVIDLGNEWSCNCK